MTSVAPGDMFLGKYRIEQVLGQGGMGVVVSARHLELDELVAIKFMHANYAGQQDQVERFLREGRAAAKIKSEHVARVRDVGKTDGGVPYMILEHLHGSDLGALIKEEGKVGIPDAVEFLLQACEALAEAHTSGIVHRDLKPGNLFLTVRADGSNCVKLLDFGISKLLDSTDIALTATNGMMGSPLYMAPEQLAAAKNVDKRADIWAIGVILYELVSGERPFDAQTLPQLVLRVASDSPTPITQWLPDAPETLVNVINRCLSKQPDDRFADVGALATALEPLAPPEARHSIERIARVIAAATTGGQKRQRTVRTSPSPDATGPNEISREEAAATMIGTPPIDAKLVQTTNGGSTRTTPPPTEKKPSRAPLAIAIGVAAAAILALVVVLGTRRDPPPAPPTAVAAPLAPSHPSPAVGGSSEGPSASIVPPPASTPLVVEPAPSVSASTKPVAKTLVPPKASTSSAPKKSCDPPYVIDADGNKKYKMECL